MTLSILAPKSREVSYGYRRIRRENNGKKKISKRAVGRHRIVAFGDRGRASLALGSSTRDRAERPDAWRQRRGGGSTGDRVGANAEDRSTAVSAAVGSRSEFLAAISRRRC